MNKSRADRCVTHHHACDCREYELQERIQQLEEELEAEKNTRAEWQQKYWITESDLNALVEAIQTHKDSFIGQEGDIVPEDDALWAALPKEKT